MTFLSVVTRCYKRPDMLARNVASLEEQAEPDYEQLFIVDDIGRGVGWANQALSTAEPAGDYVMVLDDDDMLTDYRAIELLKLATVDEPPLVIFKADHARLGILPWPTVWGKRPIRGGIGSCDFISRRDVWEKHINAFGTLACGDYRYLQSVWQDKPDVVWLDEQLAGVQRISRGAPA
jgi:glycosyltransferase involved in cell wall biosynthesis